MSGERFYKRDCPRGGAAWAYYRQSRLDTNYSRYREAQTNLERALEYEVDDQGLTANCIKSLGDVQRMQAEYEAAREQYERALPLYRDIGDRLGQANCILNLGYVHRDLAEHETARE